MGLVLERAYHFCHLHFLLRHACGWVHAGHHAARVLWKCHGVSRCALWTRKYTKRPWDFGGENVGDRWRCNTVFLHGDSTFAENTEVLAREPVRLPALRPAIITEILMRMEPKSMIQNRSSILSHIDSKVLCYASIDICYLPCA